MASSSADEAVSYRSQQAWRQIMSLLPEDMYLKDEELPVESVWEYEGHEVHLERFVNEKSPINLILLHGVGTNGRQMSLVVGAPLHKKGLASVSVDLPGYGVTKVKRGSKVTYSDWVKLVSDFIDEEKARDPRPIVLYGLSAGGMLAYHVVCINHKIAGIVGMSFLDQTNQKVRDNTAHDIVTSRVGVPFAKTFASSVLGGLRMPMRLTSKMWALVNNKQALRVFLADKTSAGNWVSTRFLADYMSYKPAIAPEDFTVCPILHTQPSADRWTPLPLSEIFTKRLAKVSVKVVVLENAGHYPLEQPGIDQMNDAIYEFATSVAQSL